VEDGVNDSEDGSQVHHGGGEDGEGARELSDNAANATPTAPAKQLAAAVCAGLAYSGCYSSCYAASSVGQLALEVVRACFDAGRGCKRHLFSCWGAQQD
jgi:hypothetical protein